ncbi:hypothetical protein G7Z17_g381 [Cylindrodendrum hubeiense]|uniref:Uncharacterized protein n=1 Tax=Cylindrodendrum hubeiense TaxID=595255 RepID=A0A9P5LGA1_9HYPO|nr:hypothetical protein G7Z17_g381 [Cylindrodendrum hubeiense]
MQSDKHSISRQDADGAEETLSPRMKISAIYRQGTAQAAQQEGENTNLWQSAYSMQISIDRRYSVSEDPRPADTFEIDLHDLWFTYYHASRAIPSNHPSQYRLIFELLQAQAKANMWLAHAGPKIITLSDNLWNDCPEDAGSVGTLVLLHNDDEARGQEISAGFSPPRWMFWLGRMQEVVEEAKQNGDDSLGEFAAKVVNNMALIVGGTDSIVRREVKAAGMLDDIDMGGFGP